VLSVAPLTGSETGFWVQLMVSMAVGAVAVALGGVIAGATSIALHVFLVPELVAFLGGSV
jgi:hypothetical protein